MWIGKGNLVLVLSVYKQREIITEEEHRFRLCRNEMNSRFINVNVHIVNLTGSKEMNLRFYCCNFVVVSMYKNLPKK